MLLHWSERRQCHDAVIHWAGEPEGPVFKLCNMHKEPPGKLQQQTAECSGKV
jgi:hypothetical protein